MPLTMQLRPAVPRCRSLLLSKPQPLPTTTLARALSTTDTETKGSVCPDSPSLVSDKLEPPATQRDQTITLPDGRLLGFAEFGDTSPSSYPLVFLHGFPSCRLEAWSLHKLLRRKRIRLIAPERPGYGLSTFQPGRRIRDWSSDVMSLVDQLGVDKFALLGGSGGGPYALSCAREVQDGGIPKERMTAVGLLAAMGPWTADGMSKEVERGLMKDVRAASRCLGRSIQVVPGLSKVVLDAWLGTTRWMLGKERWQKGLDKWLAEAEDKYAKEGGVKMDPTDTFPPPIPRHQLLALFDGIFVQGTRGMVADSRLITRDWGIDFSRIAHDKVQIWHGTKDTNAPIGAIRWMAAQMPPGQVELHEYDVDHFVMGTLIEEVLDDLITEGMRQDAGKG